MSHQPQNRPKSTGEPGRLIALGDIHGCLRPLEALLDALRLQPEDTFVILGDVINRGFESNQVVECLIALQPQTHLVFILGNHEEEMLAARTDVNALARWLAMGGVATLESYGPNAQLSDVPETHWQFLADALPWWICDDYLFTHANYDADVAMSDQTATALRWLSLQEQPPKPHCSGKTAVVGHSANLAGNVIDYGFLRCLDTGCGLGGVLTAMDVRTRQIWQCAQDSDIVVWGEQPSTDGSSSQDDQHAR